MKRIIVVSALLLLLCAVVTVLYDSSAEPTDPFRPAPCGEEEEGPGIAPVDECPIVPEFLRERRFFDAPDNAASSALREPLPVFSSLHSRLEQRIRERSLEVNLSLYDFGTGSQIKINGDKSFGPASLIKTLLLLTALEQLEGGDLSLGDTHVLSEGDKYVGGTRVAGTGRLQFAEAGGAYTVEELLSLMVGLSDNVATNILFDIVGARPMSTLAKKLGLERTSFNRKMYDHHSALPLNTATASELTRLLVALERSEAAGPGLSQRGVQMMLGTGDKRIGRYIGQHAAVANKVGTDSNLTGDMALIYPQGQPPLALTIVVQDPPGLDQSIDFIGELAALIVEHLLGVK